VPEQSIARRTAQAQGFYFLASGIWPLMSRRSFERATGPKTDFWLAQTVGVLVATIGGVLLLAERRNRLRPELELLAAASAAGLGLVDLSFSLRGRISKIYLLDAAIEAALVAGWLRSDRA
jgi:glucose uptake protein GlcU